MDPTSNQTLAEPVTGTGLGTAFEPTTVPGIGTPDASGAAASAGEATGAPARASARPGVVQLAIREKAALYAAYMPYVDGGGLFVPTTRTVNLGDELYLILSLMDDPNKLSVTGKVVWINYRTTPGGRQVGVGIQFGGADSVRLQKKIEALLAGYTRADQPTNTM